MKDIFGILLREGQTVAASIGYGSRGSRTLKPATVVRMTNCFVVVKDRATNEHRIEPHMVAVVREPEE